MLFEGCLEGPQNLSDFLHALFSFLGIFFIEILLFCRPQTITTTTIAIRIAVAIAIARNDHLDVLGRQCRVFLRSSSMGCNGGVWKYFTDARDGRAHFLRSAVTEAALKTTP